METMKILWARKGERGGLLRFIRQLPAFCGIALFCIALTACGDAAVTPYLPPTAAALSGLSAPSTRSPLPELPIPNLPTPTPPCTPALTFLADLTIPDGALVAPGEQLDKRWRVKNSGSCNWDETYRVKLLNGPDLGAPPEQALYPARSGAEAVIRMIFTAPAEPGIYHSNWQAVDPLGNAFGEVFFIEVGVAAKP